MTLATTTQVDPEQAIGRRATARLACELGVEIKQSATDWQRGLMRDVSASGFRVVVPSRAFNQDSLWLRLPDLEPIAASIRWRAGALIGCRFLYPLEAPVLRAIEALVAAGEAAAAARPEAMQGTLQVTA